MMKRSRIFCLLLALAVSLGAAGTLWAVPGEMLWEAKFNFLPAYDTITPWALAASTNSVIVCGIATNSSGTTAPRGFIKAFDVATGQPKWQGAPLTMGANQNGFDSLAVVGNTVLVSGFATSYSGTVYTLNKSILRAYNADTGELLWEVIKDYSSYNSGPISIVVANNRAFVVRNEGGYWAASGNCSVQAYQVSNVPLSGLPLLLLDK